MRLTFLGAAGCVTGSRHLAEAGTTRVLVDCGLFQGYKHVRLRNWVGIVTRTDLARVVAIQGALHAWPGTGP